MATRHQAVARSKKLSTSSKKRIMLVDDHPLVKEGLTKLIQTTTDLQVSADVSSAEEALHVLESNVPDIILLDLSMPGRNGIDFLKDLRARYPLLHVLVLSMHEESVYAERALRAGARGYIMKIEPGTKVIEAIRCVLRGDLYASNGLMTQMLKVLVSDKAGKKPKTSVEKLSDRELQVYTYIGNGIPTRDIATGLGLSFKTIQTYREHIKRKLALRSAVELVHSATNWVSAENKQPPPEKPD